MAKGDQQKVQQDIGSQNQAQGNLMNNLYNTNAGFANNYNQGSGMNLQTYDDIMGRYKNFYNDPYGSGGPGGGGGGGGGGGIDTSGYAALANNPNRFGWDPMMRGAVGDAIGGYGEFSKTGGFSDQSIQDIRARAIAPTRAVYANAQSNLDRNRSLQGFSPNYAAATTKMARELGQGISDANVNANASIAQMVQQGRMFGLSGLESAGLGGQDRSTNIDQLNLQSQLAGLAGQASGQGANAAQGSYDAQAIAAARMAALGGMTNLYGTTPAMSETFGNQVLASGNQLIAGTQLGQQNFQNRLAGTQVPTNFQQGMNNVGGFMQNVVNPIGQAIGGFAGMRQPQIKPPAGPWEEGGGG